MMLSINNITLMDNELHKIFHVIFLFALEILLLLQYELSMEYFSAVKVLMFFINLSLQM